MQKYKIKYIKNQKLNLVFNEICAQFHSEKYFNFISIQFLKNNTRNINLIAFDPHHYTNFYLKKDLISIDPYINFMVNSKREVLYFEELNEVEAINLEGEIYYPGRIINNYRASSRFKMKNGFYTFMRLNCNYIIGNSFAYEKINFKAEKFLDQKYKEGQWFSEFTRNLNFLTLRAIQEYD